MENVDTSSDVLSIKLLNISVSCEKTAYELYCDYGHHVEFSVRKDHVSYWPNSKNIKSKEFLCSKSGFKKYKKKTYDVKYHKSDIRTGCPAMVRFSIDKEGCWKIYKFVQSHNHDLTKFEDQHLLRSYRVITPEKVEVLKTMPEAGIRTVDAFSYLAEEVGGVQNIGFSKRDAYNFIQRERMSTIENEDTATLLQLFKERQSEDDMFSSGVQVDEGD